MESKTDNAPRRSAEMTCAEMKLRLDLQKEQCDLLDKYEALCWKWMTKASDLMDQIAELKGLK